jgi:hypothetical protein
MLQIQRDEGVEYRLVNQRSAIENGGDAMAGQSTAADHNGAVKPAVDPSGM